MLAFDTPRDSRRCSGLEGSSAWIKDAIANRDARLLVDTIPTTFAAPTAILIIDSVSAAFSWTALHQTRRISSDCSLDEAQAIDDVRVNGWWSPHCRNVGLGLFSQPIQVSLALDLMIRNRSIERGGGKVGRESRRKEP